MKEKIMGNNVTYRKSPDIGIFNYIFSSHDIDFDTPYKCQFNKFENTHFILTNKIKKIWQ